MGIRTWIRLSGMRIGVASRRQSDCLAPFEACASLSVGDLASPAAAAAEARLACYQVVQTAVTEASHSYGRMCLLECCLDAQKQSRGKSGRAGIPNHELVDLDLSFSIDSICPRLWLDVLPSLLPYIVCIPPTISCTSDRFQLSVHPPQSTLPRQQPSFMFASILTTPAPAPAPHPSPGACPQAPLTPPLNRLHEQHGGPQHRQGRPLRCRASPPRTPRAF